MNFEDIRNKKIDISKIEDEEKVKEIFKNLKVNAKIVEYNELGLKKDTDPELLKFKNVFKQRKPVFVIFNKK